MLSQKKLIPMRQSNRPAAIAVCAGFLLALNACGTAPSKSNAPVLSSARIAEIVASPDRSAADRTNDQRRMPEKMLAFIGVRPSMIALDLSAGGGYTSELLSRAIGREGTVYGQSQPRDPNRPPPAPAAPEGNSSPLPGPGAPVPPPPRAAGPRPSAIALAERDKKLKDAGIQAAPIVAVERRFEDPVPPEVASGRLDLVTLMFNYHDLGFLGVDRAQMNQAVFRALKPGGIYVIADHAGRPGTGISESGTLHRIDESFLRNEVEAAGFRLSAQGDFLRNPADPRDRNTPVPAQPKDEFVLKFVKPLT
jgi:predicted methyltransferase